MKKYFLIMDIGGTKTTGALFTQDGEPVDDYFHVVKSQTFKGEEAVYQNTKGVLEHIIEHFSVNMEDVLGIGVGSPGPLKAEEGIIVHAPLMGWHDFPIVKRLQEDFGKPVFLENDGNLGALAEVRCGVAKGLKNILYMTVSTGCGGGIILDGQIYRGSNDAAGEVGHMSIDPNGLECPCGSRGCFELYASGTAVSRRVREDIARGVKNEVLASIDYDPEKVEGRILTEAAERGDAYALECYRTEGHYLSVGISNLLNLLNPQAIVLGGGITKARKFFEQEMLRVLQERCLVPVDKDTIRYSVMNDRVVLYGAYWMLKEKTKA